MEQLWNVILCLVMNAIMHEGGHWIFAKIFKLNPTIKFEKWHGFVCHWDETDDKHNRIIATMGFGCQSLFGLLLVAVLGTTGTYITKDLTLWYLGIFCLHFCTYPFRNIDKASNDFNKMDSDRDPNS